MKVAGIGPHTIISDQDETKETTGIEDLLQAVEDSAKSDDSGGDGESAGYQGRRGFTKVADLIEEAEKRKRIRVSKTPKLRRVLGLYQRIKDNRDPLLHLGKTVDVRN